MSLNVPLAQGEVIGEIQGDTPLLTFQQRVTIPANAQFVTLSAPLPPFAEVVWAGLSNVTGITYNTNTISTNVVAAPTNVSNTTVSRYGIITHTSATGPATALTAGNTNTIWVLGNTTTSSATVNVNALPNLAASSAVNTNSTEIWMSLVPLATAGNTILAVGDTASTNVGFRFGTTGTQQVNCRIVYRRYVPPPVT